MMREQIAAQIARMVREIKAAIDEVEEEAATEAAIDGIDALLGVGPIEAVQTFRFRGVCAYPAAVADEMESLRFSLVYNADGLPWTSHPVALPTGEVFFLVQVVEETEYPTPDRAVKLAREWLSDVETEIDADVVIEGLLNHILREGGS